ncbi:hypothetical protein SAMN05444266_109313 [Chitinophaga jiangningensis]|uniref:Uncharacterized protein n=1 Tax=Chitinophaga jiangningensis TaxID=1419482 RepID=A0A1M7KGQ7_9BACT|nr:hypothetical protein [Chitinophaga jiangningensis]SHM64490.1 hypothetical protein SAMN05444266_109313 [Chitinophaga jiangningensis]
MNPLFLTTLTIAAIGGAIFIYKVSSRKKSIPAVLRSAAIVKINSYKSFGIMATVRFNDAGIPQVGDQIQQEGHTYKIKGVISESPQQHDQVWECKLEKI